MGKKIIPFLILLYLIVCVISLSLGRFPVKPGTVVKIVLSKIIEIEKTWSTSEENVIMKIRLPRIAASSLIGLALTLSGLTYQIIFKNPMVSPDILGASAGSAAGAAVALLLGFSSVAVSLTAFCFGLVAVFIVYLVSKAVPGQSSLTLILGGIMVGSLFQSATSFIKLIADPTNMLPSITYFLMGSLASTGTEELGLIAAPILLPSVLLVVVSYQINALSVSEDEALSMGVRTRILRSIAIISSTLMTASSVAVCGVIGWVGLVIPHVTRMITGPDASVSMPSSMLIGASFLTAVDTVSRTAATSEIPIGILTSVIGAPFFIFLLIKEGRK